MQVGQAERSPPWEDVGPDAIDSAAARALALDGARQGFVLLKNDNHTLPLVAPPQTLTHDPKHLDSPPNTRTRPLKLAVLGPHFNSSTDLLANYYGDNVLVATSTPLLGLMRRPEVSVVAALAGCDLVNVSQPPDLAGATAAAKRADVAILFMGLHSTQGPQVNNGPGMEREGYDRTNLTLPGYQEALVQAVYATGVPTVVVLINSGGLAAEWVYTHVPAVLEAYYPGELGGDALASVLLGDVSPAGRLTNTIYPAGFVRQRNITDMNLRPHDGIPGVTYRFYDDAPLFPFGYGRHYTTFVFAWNTADAALSQSVSTTELAASLPRWLAQGGKDTGLTSLALPVKVGTVFCIATEMLSWDLLSLLLHI